MFIDVVIYKPILKILFELGLVQLPGGPVATKSGSDYKIARNWYKKRIMCLFVCLIIQIFASGSRYLMVMWQ